jgi:hypothetical protein
MNSLEIRLHVSRVYEKICDTAYPSPKALPHVRLMLFQYLNDWKKDRLVFTCESYRRSFKITDHITFVKKFTKYTEEFCLLNSINRNILCIIFREISTLPTFLDVGLFSTTLDALRRSLRHLPFSDPISQMILSVYSRISYSKRFAKIELFYIAEKYNWLVSEGIIVDAVHEDIEVRDAPEQGGLDVTLEVNTPCEKIKLALLVRVKRDYPFKFPEITLVDPVPEVFETFRGKRLHSFYEDGVCPGIVELLRSLKLDLTRWLEGESDLQIMGLPPRRGVSKTRTETEGVSTAAKGT